MDGKKSSLFGDTKLDPQVMGSISEDRMFISGDLSTYNLPEEFLKEKKQIPDFAKGCLFTLFCGFLFLILVIMVGFSIDKGQYEDENVIFFVSDGQEKNISYALDPRYDVEDCYDVWIYTEANNINFNRQCWEYIGEPTIKRDSKKSITGGQFPITMYQSDIEIGTINQGDEFVEIILPFIFSNNSLLTFEAQTHWNTPSIITSYIVNESDFEKNFTIALPEYTYANDLNVRVTITDLNGLYISEDWFNKRDDCWYYESKCTLTIGVENEVGFLDLNSQILVITLEEPLSQGTSLEIRYDHYGGDDTEEIMFLFLWLPPIIFFIGLGNMIYNKKTQMIGGAGTAVLPVIIFIGIASSIILEILLY